MKITLSMMFLFFLTLSPIIYGLSVSQSSTFFYVCVSICVLFIIQKILYLATYFYTQRKILHYFAANANMMNNIALHSKSNKVLWLGPARLVSLVLLVFSFVLDFWLLLLAFSVYFMTLAGGIRHSTLPAAIYLGASSADQLEVCRKLTFQMMPLRLVSLLRLNGPSLNYMFMVGDNYRMDQIGEWRDTVRRLIGVVFIVFVDARNLTEATIEEIEYTINKQYMHKVVIVHDGPDDLKNLGSKLGDVRRLDGIFCFDAQLGNFELFDWVSRQIVKSGGTIPSRETPLAAMIISALRKS